MIRTSFEALDKMVDLIYQDQSIQTDDQIDHHCQFISAFIQTCGWTEDEYWEEKVRHEEGLTDSPARLTLS